MAIHAPVMAWIVLALMLAGIVLRAVSQPLAIGSHLFGALTVISAGDQPDDVKAEHERLALSSARGRHVVAQNSGHWVPFDQPELIVAAIREIVKTKTWHDP